VRLLTSARLSIGHPSRSRNSRTRSPIRRKPGQVAHGRLGLQPPADASDRKSRITVGGGMFMLRSVSNGGKLPRRFRVTSTDVKNA
jgi:hypothetical protein